MIPDVSGEALAVETERAGRYPAIRSLLAKCAGVLVLADAERPLVVAGGGVPLSDAGPELALLVPLVALLLALSAWPASIAAPSIPAGAAQVEATP